MRENEILPSNFHKMLSCVCSNFVSLMDVNGDNSSIVLKTEPLNSEGKLQGFSSAVFSNGGQSLAVSKYDRSGGVFDMVSNTWVFVDSDFADPNRPPCMVFSPDDGIIVCGLFRQTLVKSSSTGDVIATLDEKGCFEFLEFTKDGRYLVCTSDSSILVYSSETWECVSRGGKLLSLRNSRLFLNDTQIITVQRDKLLLWEFRQEFTEPIVEFKSSVLDNFDKEIGVSMDESKIVAVKGGNLVVWNAKDASVCHVVNVNAFFQFTIIEDRIIVYPCSITGMRGMIQETAFSHLNSIVLDIGTMTVVTSFRVPFETISLIARPTGMILM
jgi:hypothetical protein